MGLCYKSKIVKSEDYGICATLEVIYQNRNNLISQSDRYLQSALAKHGINTKSVSTVSISRIYERGKYFIKLTSKFNRIDLNVFPSIHDKIRATCLFFGIRSEKIKSIYKIKYDDFSYLYNKKTITPECWIIRLAENTDSKKIKKLSKALTTLNILFDITT